VAVTPITWVWWDKKMERRVMLMLNHHSIRGIIRGNCIIIITASVALTPVAGKKGSAALL
jgi:hypothetical protein